MVFSRLSRRYDTRFRPPTANPHSVTTGKMGKSMLIVLLLLATSILPAGAQNRDDHRDNRNNQTFNRGVRSGGRGGQYNDPRRDNRRYDNGRYNRSEERRVGKECRSRW